jgi:CRP/FNR family transcriptional regulator, dissimilatory nitrate respiration regulator
MPGMNSNLTLNNRDRAVLLNAPLLEGLSHGALTRLMSTMTACSVPARGHVMREGEPADAFYCVLSGHVRLFRLDREGREADIMVCAPGDTFGECLLFAGGTYRCQAQAAEPATVARFDMQAVRRLVEDDPEVAKALITSLSRRLIATMDCIANDRLLTAPQRVAHYILSRCPVDGGPATIRLPYQKSLLAGMLGLAPEALSRAFSSLRRFDVTVHGRTIQVADVQVLREL